MAILKRKGDRTKKRSRSKRAYQGGVEGSESESTSGSDGGMAGTNFALSSSSSLAFEEETSRHTQGDGQDRCWSTRRRDPRINGADIYVARVTKNGVGSAKPCWRCVEWCRWAGVKRIFHWNGQEHRFDVIKVNSAERQAYETNSDARLFNGSVSLSILTPNPLHFQHSLCSIGLLAHCFVVFSRSLCSVCVSCVLRRDL